MGTVVDMGNTDRDNFDSQLMHQLIPLQNHPEMDNLV